MWEGNWFLQFPKRYVIKDIKSKCDEEGKHFFFDRFLSFMAVFFLPMWSTPTLWFDEWEYFASALSDNGMLGTHRWSLLYADDRWRWLSIKSYKIKSFKAVFSTITREFSVLKLISKYRVYASIARNGRSFWQTRQTSSFCFFFCVFTIQYVEQGQCLFPWLWYQHITGRNQWLLSAPMMTFSLQTDPKTNSLFHSLFTHACFSYSFAASDIWSMNDTMAEVIRKEKKTFKLCYYRVCYILYWAPLRRQRAHQESTEAGKSRCCHLEGSLMNCMIWANWHTVTGTASENPIATHRK